MCQFEMFLNALNISLISIGVSYSISPIFNISSLYRRLEDLEDHTGV